MDRARAVLHLACASWLQVKPRTIYRWLHEGYLPAVKLGTLVRFDQDSVREWLKKRETPGRATKRVEVDID